MRVPSSPLICSTRKPRRSLPKTAVSNATSCLPSVAATRRKVACGSAAVQWIVWPNEAFIPLGSVAGIQYSVSMLCCSARGRAVLTAQNPPIGWSVTESSGEETARLFGAAGVPLNSG
eukprot:6456267-Prymnesium_polylepis.2